MCQCHKTSLATSVGGAQVSPPDSTLPFSTGAATIRIGMPTHMQSSLIFHYNLKFYDNDGDTYEGISLKRFVMQVGDGPKRNQLSLRT